MLGYLYELQQEDKPELRSLLFSVDELVVLEFLEELHGKSFAGVRNFGGYMKKVLIELLRRREI